MAELLIIGYGNPLRGDDAVGFEAAQRLRDLLPKTQQLNSDQASEIHSVVTSLDEQSGAGNPARSRLFRRLDPLESGSAARIGCPTSDRSQWQRITQDTTPISEFPPVSGLGDHYQESPEAEVLAVHQLTPELAEPISRAVRVIFIDAAAIGEPGAIEHRAVAPAPQTSRFTHQSTPGGLLAAAQALYGHTPEAELYTIAGQSFGFGDPLTPAVSAALETLIASLTTKEPSAVPRS